MDLKGAQLSKAALVGANFSFANLSGANLDGADLTEALLLFAHLDNALLIGANLYGADFVGADLRHAKLYGADLRGANLIQTDLDGAKFDGVQFENTFYEPTSQPPVSSIASARGLDRLLSLTNPEPLHALWKGIQDAGFVRQGREITASIQRDRLEHSWICIGGKDTCVPGSLRYKLRYTLPKFVNRAAFDWTCAWGADWSHPLVLLGWLCLVCGPVYWVGMHFGRVGGIYQIVLDTTVVTKASKELVTRVETGVRWGGRPALRTRTFGQGKGQTQIPFGNDKPEGQQQARGLHSLPKRARRMRSEYGPALRAEWRALRLAFLFSVLSALDIGFHEFNVGQWARMLLARDFNLKARGWMRVAGGVQSLVGGWWRCRC